MKNKLEPKLLSVLRRGYSKKDFIHDLTGGIIVGIVALPLAIAFAIASGVKPEQGLYTAVIAGFIIALLGGSKTQVSGPTGAFIVIIYGIVQKYGYDGLAIATLTAGVLLIIMGIARLGIFLKFIPYPVIVGFTSGIALIIFSSQVRDFLGLAITKVPAEFVDKWVSYGENIGTFNPNALIVGTVSLLIIIFWGRLTRKVPGSLAAIILATLAVHLFNIPVETIGSRFGAVPNQLPSPAMPSVTWSLITQTFSPAITIALLCAIESLLSATVADGMIGTKHNPNMELIAQGIGNIASPFFFGIPATGAIARTATNIKNGGRTPVAAIIHALVLFFIMLFFGRWASLIPMATLAAILIVVAYNMSEWRAFVKTFRSTKSDISVLLTTFGLTVLIDLTVAIETGMVLGAFLFLQRMMEVTEAGYITEELEEDPNDPNAVNRLNIPDGVEVFEIFGPLFFGVIEKFQDALSIVDKKPKVLILRMRNVPAIDAAGLRALENLHKQTLKHAAALIISGMHPQPFDAAAKAGLFIRIGQENFCKDIDCAIERSRYIIEKSTKSSRTDRS